jgi:hypothetical protein
MRQWLEQKSTTNLLLLAICILLGLHLMIKASWVTTARAQEISRDTTSTLISSEALSNIDDNIKAIKENVLPMRTDVRQLQRCIVTTPTGGYAIATKESGIH